MAAAQTRVLVVDDDASIRLLCRVNLELNDYAVNEAESLAEARAVLAEVEVQAVLLDLALGAEDGLALLQELQEGGLDVPVVLLTGRDGAATYGLAQAVLQKPFQLEDLVSTIDLLAGPAAIGRLRPR
jgi:DNA-binding NtrC family response regulator